MASSLCMKPGSYFAPSLSFSLSLILSHESGMSSGYFKRQLQRIKSRGLTEFQIIFLKQEFSIILSLWVKVIHTFWVCFPSALKKVDIRFNFLFHFITTCRIITLSFEIHSRVSTNIKYIFICYGLSAKTFQ